MDLPRICDEAQLSRVIQETVNKVLILRFGNQFDSTCMHLDNILSKSVINLSNMAVIFTIELELDKENETFQTYLNYFDINYIPSTIFFFNGHHIKIDYGLPDHSKLIGTLKEKQDLIDLIECIYRTALKGKTFLLSPISKERLFNYQLYYNDY
ncbi:thioredoxin-like 4B [Neoconidiobolus thromboides FSU 785]|nr:thioredoxin-like 4B [Neoconidiobolus thromboides FSU 785]